jgi:hypothetical protein
MLHRQNVAAHRDRYDEDEDEDEPFRGLTSATVPVSCILAFLLSASLRRRMRRVSDVVVVE